MKIFFIEKCYFWKKWYFWKWYFWKMLFLKINIFEKGYFDDGYFWKRLFSKKFFGKRLFLEKVIFEKKIYFEKSHFWKSKVTWSYYQGRKWYIPLEASRDVSMASSGEKSVGPVLFDLCRGGGHLTKNGFSGFRKLTQSVSEWVAPPPRWRRRRAAAALCF